MTDMIERVARAIVDAMCEFSGEPLATDSEWTNRKPDASKMFDAMAIAAIKAMREPTDEMVNLGEHCADGCYKIDPCGKGAEHIFITMIDAALGENK